MIEQLINNALKYARGKNIRIEFDEQSNQLHVKIMVSVLVKRTCLKYLIRAIQVIMASAKEKIQVGLVYLS